MLCVRIFECASSRRFSPNWRNSRTTSTRAFVFIWRTIFLYWWSISFASAGFLSSTHNSTKRFIISSCTLIRNVRCFRARITSAKTSNARSCLPTSVNSAKVCKKMYVTKLKNDYDWKAFEIDMFAQSIPVARLRAFSGFTKNVGMIKIYNQEY